MEDKLIRPLLIPKENLVICKADPGTRIWGKLVDTAIDAALLVVLIMIFINQNSISALNQSSNTFTILIVVYQVISLFLNLIVPVLTKGQTLGKMAAKTRMIHIDGNAGNIIIYLVRQSFFTVIALLGQIDGLANVVQGVLIIIYIILIIGIFSDEHGRTLQDKFAKTIVVNDNIYKTYREKAFHEIDHPLPILNESNDEERQEGETTPLEVQETFNQSINKEEEII